MARNRWYEESRIEQERIRSRKFKQNQQKPRQPSRPKDPELKDALQKIRENLPMSKIRKSARGMQCQVRIPGVCNFRTDTTVLAHLNGYGIAGKHHDFQGAYCCYECHQAIDGHTNTDFSLEEIKLFHLEGIMRTQAALFEMKLIETKGSK